MMGERTRFKAGEQSQLALFCNAKEEILLKKQLRILESMKKQAENALTLDQRILYNRFTLKLRRSELAHARLLGKKDLVKQLSLSLFPNFHSVVTDGSEKAVRAILQHNEASRAFSAPCQIQTHLAPEPPLLVAKQDRWKDLQGKEAEVKNGQKCFAAAGEINAQTEDLRRNTRGARRVSIPSKPVSFLEYKRPCTTRQQKCDKLSNMNYRYREIVVKIPSEQQDPALKAIESGLPSSPEGLIKKGCLEQNCKGSRNKWSHKPRLSARNLFLGLNNTPLEAYQSMHNYVAANNDTFNTRVKLFLQKVTALKQEQDGPLQDYYSERLLENVGRKYQVNQEFLMDTEQERNKWNLVGPETKHQSITIKKLDTDFTSKESPLEMMTWEYYNEILTKENLIERNWLNNNPYQLITT